MNFMNCETGTRVVYNQYWPVSTKVGARRPVHVWVHSVGVSYVTDVEVVVQISQLIGVHDVQRLDACEGYQYK